MAVLASLRLLALPNSKLTCVGSGVDPPAWAHWGQPLALVLTSLCGQSGPRPQKRARRLGLAGQNLLLMLAA